MIEFTIDTIVSEKHATIKDAESITGRDKLFIGRAVKTANLEALGVFKGGGRGRPPKVFDRTALIQVINALVKQEAEQAAAEANQTNVEDSETQSQVA